MYLFKEETIKSFFKKLDNYSSNIKSINKPSDAANFTSKALNYLINKYFIIYNKSEDVYSSNLYKLYIKILYISCRRSDKKLSIYYLDASKPNKLNEIHLGLNEVLELLGKEITIEEFENVKSLFVNDLPQVNFNCGGYDWTTHDKNNVRVRFDVKATHYDEAVDLAKKYCKENNLEFWELL